MKCKVVLISIVLLSLVLVAQAVASETYFKFNIESREELLKLTRVISIDNVKDKEVYAYANDDQLAEFEKLGYAYTVLPHPGSLISPKMATTKDGMKDWDSYPSYETYVDMMYQFETDYPNICDVQTIGYSVQGREIIFAKISDNVGVEENEPEVLFTSTMHGDETTGYILMLRLIDSLLTGYGTDPRITNMVRSMEIWINPLANPDGTYITGNSSVSGAQRCNANGVDPNRNFPDPEDGPHPDGHSWQPETIAMMDFAEAHSFVISANFHGGAEVVNYPWDTWVQRHADDAWFIDISRKYADSCHAHAPSTYMDGFDDGITNGYDWYTISGGRQDYMTYFRGGREVTIELSNTKLLPASQLPAHWEYNKVSFLDYLENALYGIRGIVTDASSGDPVAAVVTVLNHDVDSARVFTDPDIGDYHRMIKSGTWDLKFSADGYVTKIINDVSIADGGVMILNVQLEPLTSDPSIDFFSQSAGLVDPGDDVSMNITLVNYGGGDALNVAATLATEDNYVTITQDYSTYPMISQLGGEAVSNTSYEFQVLPSCPLYHTAEFELYITASGGYIDTVTFDIEIGQQTENFETGSFASYPWEMIGSQPWTIVSSDVYEGTYCAKSGNIGNNQYTAMQVTMNVIESGTISFHYKVSSESGWDFLEFYIDATKKGSWSGSIGWTEASYAVDAGLHTFEWKYEKDSYSSAGSDCGWIDLIIFPPSSGSPEIITENLPDWTEDVSYSQQLEATGGYGTLTWSDLSGDLSGTGLTLSTSGLVSGTPTSSGQISFTAHVEDESEGYDNKPFSFTINPILAITTASLPNGTVGEPYSAQLQVTGGTGTKTWSDLNSDLEGSGLSVSSSGLIEGTPLSEGLLNFTAYVGDEVGASTDKPLSIEVETGWICGDADGSGAVDIDDAVFLVNYIFAGGPEPSPAWVGDVDCSGAVDVDDVVYLIAYIFSGGSAPCEGC